MAAGLRISADLSLPIEATTQAVAILAKRGAGKTYTAGVWAEEMLGAGLQVVILDPMGAWYGLRSSADGKGPGYPIAVLGGEHADVPLEATGGGVVADLAVDERLSMILDQSAFSKNERRRFVTDFLERLYHRNREAMHVILEEADLYAPQRYGQGEERMLGAVFDLVRRGRGRGLGSTLITQRSATLNNEVLEQADVLMALRTTGPADRKAIDRWIDVHDDLKARTDVRDSLPSLPTGTAWVWWPEQELLKRVAIREKRTFDSSATPTPGQVRRAPKTVADVDLTALTERMAATIEKAKADDPKELRRRIAHLEAESKARLGIIERRAEPEVREVRIEVPVLNGQVEDLRAVVKDVQGFGSEIGGYVDAIVLAVNNVTAAIDRATAAPRPAPHAIPVVTPRPMAGSLAPSPSGNLAERTGAPRSGGGSRSPAEATSPGVASASLGKAERGILSALATYPEPLTREQLAFLAGYHPRSKGFTNALGVLRSSELVSPGFPAELTAAGRGVAPAPEHTLDELVEVWRSRFGRAERAVLDELIAVFPASKEREDLAAAAGFEHIRSKGFVNALGRLRGLGLVDGLALSEGFARLVGR